MLEFVFPIDSSHPKGLPHWPILFWVWFILLYYLFQMLGYPQFFLSYLCSLLYLAFYYLICCWNYAGVLSQEVGDPHWLLDIGWLLLLINKYINSLLKLNKYNLAPITQIFICWLRQNQCLINYNYKSIIVT